MKINTLDALKRAAPAAYRAAVAKKCERLTMPEAKRLLREFAEKADCDDFVIADLKRAYSELAESFASYIRANRPREIHHYIPQKKIQKEVAGYDECGRIIAMTEREVDDAH